MYSSNIIHRRPDDRKNKFFKKKNQILDTEENIVLDFHRLCINDLSLSGAQPMELNNMMTNIENNGAPWPYNQMDRLNWKDE